MFSIMWLLKPPYKAIHALSFLWLFVEGGLWRRPPDCHFGTVHNALALAGYILRLGPNQPVVCYRTVSKKVPNPCSAVFAVRYPKKSENSGRPRFQHTQEAFIPFLNFRFSRDERS